MKNNIIIRWLFGCLIFFNASCQQNMQKPTVQLKLPNNLQVQLGYKKISTQLDSLKKMVEAGDVITRTGNDFTSQSLKTLNRKDKTFSHCGIASIENDSVFIYHAIGGEWNPDQKIKRESFEKFTSINENNMVGIYRFITTNSVKKNIINQAQILYKKNVTFDMDFDLKTDDKMYCTEFVYKVITWASYHKIKINHSFIRSFEFIGVDDIVLHPLSKKIALLKYKL